MSQHVDGSKVVTVIQAPDIAETPPTEEGAPEPVEPEYHTFGDTWKADETRQTSSPTKSTPITETPKSVQIPLKEK